MVALTELKNIVITILSITVVFSMLIVFFKPIITLFFGNQACSTSVSLRDKIFGLGENNIGIGFLLKKAAYNKGINFPLLCKAYTEEKDVKNLEDLRKTIYNTANNVWFNFGHGEKNFAYSKNGDNPFKAYVLKIDFGDYGFTRRDFLDWVFSNYEDFPNNSITSEQIKFFENGVEMADTEEITGEKWVTFYYADSIKGKWPYVFGQHALGAPEAGIYTKKIPSFKSYLECVATVSLIPGGILLSPAVLCAESSVLGTTGWVDCTYSEFTHKRPFCAFQLETDQVWIAINDDLNAYVEPCTPSNPESEESGNCEPKTYDMQKPYFTSMRVCDAYNSDNCEEITSFSVNEVETEIGDSDNCPYDTEANTYTCTINYKSYFGVIDLKATLKGGATKVEIFDEAGNQVENIDYDAINQELQEATLTFSEPRIYNYKIFLVDNDLDETISNYEIEYNAYNGNEVECRLQGYSYDLINNVCYEKGYAYDLVIEKERSEVLKVEMPSKTKNTITITFTPLEEEKDENDNIVPITDRINSLFLGLDLINDDGTKTRIDEFNYANDDADDFIVSENSLKKTIDLFNYPQVIEENVDTNDDGLMDCAYKEIGLSLSAEDENNHYVSFSGETKFYYDTCPPVSSIPETTYDTVVGEPYDVILINNKYYLVYKDYSNPNELKILSEGDET